MSEARKGVAVLDDVDEDTFVRFSQFVYTGDYIPSSPVKPADVSEEGKISSKIPRWRFGTPPKYTLIRDTDDPNSTPQAVYFPNKYEKKRGQGFTFSPPKEIARRNELWETFGTLPCSRPIATTSSLTQTPARTKQQWSDNDAEPLLCHARLYVFGQKYGIKPLETLAIHKLWHLLVSFTLGPSKTGAIVELLQYTYSNTPDLNQDVDDLRHLVSHYVACECKTMAESEDFSQLIEQGGPFVRDYMKMIVKQVH